MTNTRKSRANIAGIGAGGCDGARKWKLSNSGVAAPRAPRLVSSRL